MDEVTADQKQKFAYLTSLWMNCSRANDGLHNGMTAAIEKLRQKSPSPESNDAVDTVAAASSSKRRQYHDAVQAEASPSVVAWPSGTGTGGEEEHHPGAQHQQRRRRRRR